MLKLSTMFKVLAVSALVMGFGLMVIGSDVPTPIQPLPEGDGADYDLKAEMAPVHLEPGEPGEDDVDPEIDDTPDQQLIDQKEAERLALSKAHQFSLDLRAMPEDAEGVQYMHPMTEILFEGFETWPPTDWTLIETQTTTWEQWDVNPYEGLYKAHCTYTTAGNQDEWMITPSLDLTTGGATWVLDFWWNGSYYWSVDPYDNCDLTVYINVGSGWEFLWTEPTEAWTTWQWYNVVIPLTAYLTATDAQIAFVYTGYDGAEFSVDAVSINDAAPPVGRCCYGVDMLECADVTEAECGALGGNWNESLDCTTPCPSVPPNDDWQNATEIYPPTTVTGSTENATLDCPGVLDWNAVWYVFEAPYAENDVDVDFCGTVPGLTLVGVVLYADPVVCADYILRTDFEWWDCGDGEDNPHIWWDRLPGPATYYFPVYTGNGKDIMQPFSFDITVDESPELPAGGSCGDPFLLSLGSGDLPYTEAGLLTCGMSNVYDATCLGYYDGGEDFIVELTLTENLTFSVKLDPKGTTYTGISIDDECPDTDETCIAYSTNSSSGIHGITGLSLTAGTYYLMIDTWPSPDCIPEFDLIFEEFVVQPGDNCDDPIPIAIPAELPYFADNQYTCGRGNNYSNTCLGSYDEDEDIIYELTVTAAVDITITMDPKGTSGTNGLMVMENCPPLDDLDCIVYNTIYGAVNIISGLHLEPGTYYIMVDHYSGTCLPDFSLEIEEYIIQAGDNCGDPYVVKLPDDMVDGPNNDQFINVSYTCGRGDNYDATCLGYYDGGEDMIYMLDVSGTVEVNFQLSSTTTYKGMSLDDECPDADATCINYVTASSGDLTMNATLTTGYYYLQIDTWPSPDCIPEFTLTIGPQPDYDGDNWDECVELSGDVVDLPYTTTGYTADGPGGCMTSPNRWYCYTASETGLATVSLCGSSYDTKLAVYDGTDPYSDVELGCNDDAPCAKDRALQSELNDLPFVNGNTYLVEVGGYGSNSGDGIINIWIDTCTPPDNDNCEGVTPVTLFHGVTETFTGDNTCATNQCGFFPGGHTWHAITLPTQMDVTLDYCTNSPAWGNAWLNLAIGCPCSDYTFAASFNTSDCGDGNVTMTWDDLPAGTYYYPVLKDPGYGSVGPYTLHVVGYAPSLLTIDPPAIDFGTQPAGSMGDQTLTLGAQGAGDINFGIDYLYSLKTYNEIPYTFLGATEEEKPTYSGPANVPSGQKQGGEDVGSATVIGALPYYDLGTTAGYAHDYDEVCPYGPHTSPDVVYSYTPGADIVVDIDLCASGYDTKLFLYENTVTPGAPFACNDDGCPGYRSALYELQLYGGNTYYIVIDGYSGAFGDYVLDMYEYAEPTGRCCYGVDMQDCVVNTEAECAALGGDWDEGNDCTDPCPSLFECPPGAIAENEACGDDTNGGCNMATPAFEPVNCGDTICGTAWADGGTRDTDWYELTFYAQVELTVTASANFEFITGPVDTSDCALAAAIDPYVIGAPNTVQSVTKTVGPGTYWVFMGFLDYYDYPCGTNNDYWITFTCPEGPVLWLSAAPETGTVPAGGTLPVTVSYDATELTNGIYNADLKITHDGRGDTLVPCQITIGEVVPPDTLVLDPDPISSMMVNDIEGVDPTGNIYIGDDLGWVNPVVTVIGDGRATIPCTGEMIGYYPGLTPPILKLTFDLSNFTAMYVEGPMWDCETRSYVVSGTDDGGPISAGDDFSYCGHGSGDLTLDGVIDISDLVMMVEWMFGNGPVPEVIQTADVDGSGTIDIADLVALVDYMFNNGAPPVQP